MKGSIDVEDNDSLEEPPRALKINRHVLIAGLRVLWCAYHLQLVLNR